MLLLQIFRYGVSNEKNDSLEVKNDKNEQKRTYAYV